MGIHCVSYEKKLKNKMHASLFNMFHLLLKRKFVKKDASM